MLVANENRRSNFPPSPERAVSLVTFAAATIIGIECREQCEEVARNFLQSAPHSDAAPVDVARAMLRHRATMPDVYPMWRGFSEQRLDEAARAMAIQYGDLKGRM